MAALTAILLTAFSRPRLLPRISRGVRMAASIGNFEAELFSPTRISIFTRVVGRRADGCHDNLSLMQAMDFGDSLSLARIPGDEKAAAGVVRPSRTQEPIKQHCEFTFSPADVSMPSDETNLVVRAITLFRLKLRERDGGSFSVPRFRAHLVKRVPIDAGLSGAASNAATALFGANELCGRPATTEELIEWASSDLGVDAAGFLAGVANGSGSLVTKGVGVFHKGNILEPVVPLAGPRRGLTPLPCFLVVPEVASMPSTPAVFRALSATQYESLSSADPRTLLIALGAYEGAYLTPALAETLPADGDLFVNDLSAPTLTASEDLQSVVSALRGFDAGLKVSLSGSGPALFVVGEPPFALDPTEGADAYAARLAEEVSASTGVTTRAWAARFVRPTDDDDEQGGRWYRAPLPFI